MKIRNALRAVVTKISTIMADYSAAGLDLHASSSAFFLFTSLIPMVIIVVCIVSYTGIVEQDVLQLVSSILPEALNDLSQSVVHEAYANISLVLTMSIVTLIWTASKGMTSLTLGLNAAYGIEERNGWLRRLVVSLLAVVVLVLLLAGAMYLIFSGVVTRAFAAVLPNQLVPDALSSWVSVIVLVLAAVIGLDLCYTFLPAGARRLREQLPGAVLGTIVWLLFSLVFRVYIDSSSHFTLLYGSLAATAVFLLWLYYVMDILFIGALFNRRRKEWFGGKAEGGDTE